MGIYDGVIKEIKTKSYTVTRYLEHLETGQIVYVNEIAESLECIEDKDFVENLLSDFQDGEFTVSFQVSQYSSYHATMDGTELDLDEEKIHWVLIINKTE